MTKHYDAVVLGSGNAGISAANTIRAAGKTVAVIEQRDVGGTCPIRGCVPKKVLVAAAEVLDQIERASEHHIHVNLASIDWPSLIRREQSFVRGVSADFVQSLQGRGIHIYHGNARFVGPDTVCVANEILKADALVIATGSHPRPLSIDGSEHTLTSDDLLNLSDLPDSLMFIGGGVIALEFAHVLARAGTRVTILEAERKLLPRFDEGAVTALAGECRRIGIELYTNVDVTNIEQREESLEVSCRVDDRTRTFTAQKVANGTGRAPNVMHLDLEAAGIEATGSRIAVDEYLRSVSNRRVYVAGDALWSSAQLSPLATYEGKLVGQNICNGPSVTADYDAVPATVFSVPALSTVGLTESEVQRRRLQYEAKLADMSAWRSARTHAETVAYSKVLLEKNNGRILGAHLVGHGSAEIIHLFSFAMQHGVPASTLREAIYSYPTFSSDIKYLI